MHAIRSAATKRPLPRENGAELMESEISRAGTGTGTGTLSLVATLSVSPV